MVDLSPGSMDLYDRSPTNSTNGSCGTGDSTEGSVEREESPCTSRPWLPEHACTICRVEEATVSHFGVDVCTGCRAFFRRSVAQQKTYRCLNSKLCGKSNLVPNRRVCKYCRFQRCVDAGMLKSKEELHTMKLEATRVGLRDPALAFHLPNPESVLGQFAAFRRNMTYLRLQSYYLRKSTDKERFVDCTHVTRVGLLEMERVEQLLARSPTFATVSDTDRVTLIADYSIVWTVLEQLCATVRNGGHLSRRVFFPDGSSLQLTEDIAFKHWRPIFMSLKDTRPMMAEMIGRFLLALSIYNATELTRSVASVSMSEEEMAAFTALLFLRPEILSQVSTQTRSMLQGSRQQLLANLAQHIRSTGQKVEERMPKIIMAMSDVQAAVRMIKQVINLLRVATFEDSVLPKSYVELFASSFDTLSLPELTL